MKDIRPYIRKLPINSSQKLRLYNSIHRLYWKYKYSPDEYVKCLEKETFIPTNHYYGHEYWLRHYSGYNDYIYGMIEHGVYFGDNKNKVGQVEEWDMGSIITFGESRIKLLKELYPDFNIIGVGPRIHYADIDYHYYRELQSSIDKNSKTMVLYPHHSLYEKESKYDVNKFMSEASIVAKDLNVKNIMVSLHPADIAHGFKELYEGKRFITVTGGANAVDFLPRLKAIMSLADIIYSNTLGTHVGYGLYMKKPVVMNLDSKHAFYNNIKFQEEELKFANAFNGRNPYEITKEQTELCDYYFGFSHVKTPMQLSEEFEKCKREYERRFR